MIVYSFLTRRVQLYYHYLNYMANGLAVICQSIIIILYYCTLSILSSMPLRKSKSILSHSNIKLQTSDIDCNCITSPINVLLLWMKLPPTITFAGSYSSAYFA